MATERAAAVTALTETQSTDHFLIVLSRARTLKYRGLYSVNPNFIPARPGEQPLGFRLHGDGGAELWCASVEEWVKYDSASKQFQPLASKNMPPTTDGVVLLAKAAPRVRREGSQSSIDA